MISRLIKIIVLAVMMQPGVAEPSLAQQASWQRIAPVGESFTLLMPTQAFEATHLIPLNDKDSIPERVYYSLAGGKRYMVTSFVKTSPDRVPALSNFDNFMRAMEESFRSYEGEVSSLTFDSDPSEESGIVKQYQVKLGEYSGVARFLGTQKNFYALMVIGADKNDAEAQRFLTSFMIGETNTNAQSSGVIVDVPANHAEFERVRNASPPEPWPKTAGPIIGGVLNGKAVSLPKPKFPDAARKAHESGMVSVKIVIDEQGYVIHAEAVEGPLSLRSASVEAGWKARFTPTRLMGQPVKVTGLITYNFVAQ
jgi:Gram-negative bacterial TonB protein C-terminal